jgi:hypothetical protein
MANNQFVFNLALFHKLIHYNRAYPTKVQLRLKICCFQPILLNKFSIILFFVAGALNPGSHTG